LNASTAGCLVASIQTVIALVGSCFAVLKPYEAGAALLGAELVGAELLGAELVGAEPPEAADAVGAELLGAGELELGVADLWLDEHAARARADAARAAGRTSFRRVGAGGRFTLIMCPVPSSYRTMGNGSQRRANGVDHTCDVSAMSQ
jgi:hypothetical protein